MSATPTERKTRLSASFRLAQRTDRNALYIAEGGNDEKALRFFPGQAEAGKANVSLARAYELFEEPFKNFRRLRILFLTPQAESLYQQWRQQGIHLATHDLRIAATCIVQVAKLISRNRRDFEHVPGLVVEFW